jgi:hypothetical protein
MTRTSTLTALLTALSLAAPFAASAQEGQPPAMPTAKIAAALGVSEATVQNCFPKPPSKDSASKAKPERPDTAAMTTCLKADNKSLTEAKVTKAMEEFAPARPPRG